MSFESFPNMNTNPNEKVSHTTPEQMAAADAILKGSTLSLENEPKKEGGVAHFGGELNVHLMQEKKSMGGAITNNPFDEAGRHVVGDEEAAKAAEILKKLGGDANGLTLQ
jgi:hypothetical protein